MRISASAALRTVQQECEEESNGKISEVMDNVCSDVRKRDYPRDLEEAILSKAVELVGDLAKSESNAAPGSLIPARVQTIRDYIAEMERESEAWKKLMSDRKAEYQASRKEHRAASKGELKVTLSDVVAYAGGKEDPLQMSGVCSAMQRLLQQERDFRLSENNVYENLKRGKKRLASASAQVDLALKKIILYSHRLNVEDSTDIQQQQQCDAAEKKTNFAMEVETYLQEIQN
jgi:hypothetical protein